MGTYTRIIYHVVFATRRRERTLTKEGRIKLFAYMIGILQKKKCYLYIINGVEDHIHILFDLHPDITLSSLIKDIKMASTVFIKQEKLFPNFRGWQEGFGAFTVSSQSKERVIEYIENQEQRHMNMDSKQEQIDLLNEAKIKFDEKYL